MVVVGGRHDVRVARDVLVPGVLVLVVGVLVVVVVLRVHAPQRGAGGDGGGDVPQVCGGLGLGGRGALIVLVVSPGAVVLTWVVWRVGTDGGNGIKDE